MGAAERECFNNYPATPILDSVGGVRMCLLTVPPSPPSSTHGQLPQFAERCGWWGLGKVENQVHVPLSLSRWIWVHSKQGRLEGTQWPTCLLWKDSLGKSPGWHPHSLGTSTLPWWLSLLTLWFPHSGSIKSSWQVTCVGDWFTN